MNLKLNAAAPAALLALHDLVVARNMDFIYDDAGGGSGGWGVLLVAGIGAAIGYYAERAWNKRKLDKEGGSYSSEYLGGKVGAVIGAIALPVLIGMM